VAAPANVDVDFGPVGQGDVDHRMSARWTKNPAAPSPPTACSHNGLIDSGVKRLRNSSIVVARPPQLSHAQKTLPEVRTSFNGSSQRGQMSAVSVVIGYGLHSQ